MLTRRGTLEGYHQSAGILVSPELVEVLCSFNRLFKKVWITLVPMYTDAKASFEGFSFIVSYGIALLARCIKRPGVEWRRGIYTGLNWCKKWLEVSINCKQYFVRGWFFSSSHLSPSAGSLDFCAPCGCRMAVMPLINSLWNLCKQLSQRCCSLIVLG